MEAHAEVPKVTVPAAPAAAGRPTKRSEQALRPRRRPRLNLVRSYLRSRTGRA